MHEHRPTPPRAYRAADLERRSPAGEPHRERTAFQEDHARILRSAALRRLGGTTQVIPSEHRDLPFSDIRRTRLTHSHECAQIGQEMAAALGSDPYLVSAACLAHDLGHPPFGHNGESALDAFAHHHGGFEGNAQTLRILTRLEARSQHPDLGPLGLDLTRATLDAATKYPWRRGRGPSGPHTPKFGAYDDDLPVFEWMRDEAPSGSRCVEAQIMDWADDVSYAVHDLEDAFLAGHVRTGELTSKPDRDELLRVAATHYAPAGTEVGELEEALERLTSRHWWPRDDEHDSHEAQSRLKHATERLVSRFRSAALHATRTRHGARPLTRYSADLVVPRTVRVECDLLKAINHFYVIHDARGTRRRRDQIELLTELAYSLLRAPDKMSPRFLSQFLEADDERARIRAVTDQIASLDDLGALTLRKAIA